MEVVFKVQNMQLIEDSITHEEVGSVDEVVSEDEVEVVLHSVVDEEDHSVVQVDLIKVMVNHSTTLAHQCSAVHPLVAHHVVLVDQWFEAEADHQCVEVMEDTKVILLDEDHASSVAVVDQC